MKLILETSFIFDQPAVDGGEEAAQLWIGSSTNFSTTHGVKDEDESTLLGTLQDRVRWHGAPEAIATDNAAVYRGSKFAKYCRDLYIWMWQTESVSPASELH